MKIIEYGELTFKFHKKKPTCTLLSCDKNAVNVIVPRVVYGAVVLHIENYAFKDCSLLESVTFEDFESLPEDLDQPNNFYYIGRGAFANCSALKKIEFPSYVECIYDEVFDGCNSLERVTFDTNKCQINYAIFSHLKSLKYVSSVNEVYDYMFYGCKSLEVFPVSDQTLEIGDESFAGCDKLTNITIPKSVKKIKPLAFRNCQSLASITFEDPENWLFFNKYECENESIDFSNPETNANILKTMYKNDGYGDFFKKY